MTCPEKAATRADRRLLVANTDLEATAVGAHADLEASTV